MTMPRELSLHSHAGDMRVHSVPVAEVSSLQEDGFVIKALDLQQDQSLDLAKLQQSRLSFEFKGEQALSFKVGNGEEYVALTYDPADGALQLDRSNSGAVDFKETFVNGIQMCPVSTEAGTRLLELYLDQSSLEVFLDGGRYVMTNQIFPTKPYDRISFEAQREQRVSNITMNPISIVPMAEETAATRR